MFLFEYDTAYDTIANINFEFYCLFDFILSQDLFLRTIFRYYDFLKTSYGQNSCQKN